MAHAGTCPAFAHSQCTNDEGVVTGNGWLTLKMGGTNQHFQLSRCYSYIRIYIYMLHALVFKCINVFTFVYECMRIFKLYYPRIEKKSRAGMGASMYVRVSVSTYQYCNRTHFICYAFKQS